MPDDSVAYDPSAYQFKAADPHAIRARRSQKQQQGPESTRGTLGCGWRGFEQAVPDSSRGSSGVHQRLHDI